MGHHRGLRTLGAFAVWAALIAIAPAAWAQQATPTAVPRVNGQVSGSLEVGSSLTVRIDAVMPGGWDALHLVEVSIRTDGREAERLTYDIEDAKLELGGGEIVVGTGAEASGDLLRVRGSDVVVTTGAANLSFTVTAEVIRQIAQDARFELSVTGDRGEVGSVRRRFGEPSSRGLTWGTVVAAVVLALFAGGFVGNLYASRRRPPARLSVYGTIQRRLEAERSASGERPR